MDGRLSTGVDVLDRELGGGIPAGSVVAFHAPPASQGELLLYQITVPRPTLYLTTDRTEEAVRDSFKSTNAPTGDPQIHYAAGDDPLDSARRAFRAAPEEATVVIDPNDALERTDRSRYESFLNELSNHMHNTGSVAFLHCLTGEYTPALRDTTKHMADVIFDLKLDVTSSSVETRLTVPKLRGGRALVEPIKLDLQERVRVDTSRDIA